MLKHLFRKENKATTAYTLLKPAFISLKYHFTIQFLAVSHFSFRYHKVSCYWLSQLNLIYNTSTVFNRVYQNNANCLHSLCEKQNSYLAHFLNIILIFCDQRGYAKSFCLPQRQTASKNTQLLQLTTPVFDASARGAPQQYGVGPSYTRPEQTSCHLNVLETDQHMSLQIPVSPGYSKLATMWPRPQVCHFV